MIAGGKWRLIELVGTKEISVSIVENYGETFGRDSKEVNTHWGLRWAVKGDIDCRKDGAKSGSMICVGDGTNEMD